LAVEQFEQTGSARVQAVAKTLKAGRFDGVLLTPPLCDEPQVLALLEKLGIAYARLAPGGQFDRSAYAFMDDRQAAQDMTDRLWALGHRRIAFIGGQAEHGAAFARRDGFLDAMRTHGGQIGAEWIAEGDFRSTSAFAFADRWLTAPLPPSAIFAANDAMAVGVLAAAAKQGFHVPRDLSVVGFDDAPLAESTWPPLTTVHQPISEMAEAATEMLIEALDSPGRTPPQARKLDYHIVERASLGPPRA
jgi:LacI family transcriptional regulator